MPMLSAKSACADSQILPDLTTWRLFVCARYCSNYNHTHSRRKGILLQAHVSCKNLLKIICAVAWSTAGRRRRGRPASCNLGTAALCCRPRRRPRRTSNLLFMSYLPPVGFQQQRRARVRMLGHTHALPLQIDSPNNPGGRRSGSKAARGCARAHLAGNQCSKNLGCVPG